LITISVTAEAAESVSGNSGNSTATAASGTQSTAQSIGSDAQAGYYGTTMMGYGINTSTGMGGSDIDLNYFPSTDTGGAGTSTTMYGPSTKYVPTGATVQEGSVEKPC